MSAQDAMFLHVENDVTPMHIGGVSIFEGPPPPFAEVRAMVSSKLHHTPRYRQKVRLVPLGLGEPVWVDDPYFDIHVLTTGIEAGLAELLNRAHASGTATATATATACAGLGRLHLPRDDIRHRRA